MRYFTLRLAALLLSFGLGLVFNVTWRLASGSYYAVDEKLLSPVSQLREDEWHRLYEAAGMTGNRAIYESVRDELMCTNADGISDARPVEINMRGWCKRADGTVYEINSINGLYGRFNEKIMREHQSWALKNLSFVNSISTPRRARAYLIEHRR
ncbi:MAG TPA: hypothetical protein VM911_04430 [Pyrinomonadaceae bacterium]|jgi:hypothetical protein|nr:hypothetical protein [Pyrinomonadaceae bacterium]